ncbi:hypothetical protein O0L34_g19408 [Tuta absoluta]|nr:hypothetical protein O0L34_g19408 [Tuta absoluta]
MTKKDSWKCKICHNNNRKQNQNTNTKTPCEIAQTPQQRIALNKINGINEMSTPKPKTIDTPAQQIQETSQSPQGPIVDKNVSTGQESATKDGSIEHTNSSILTSAPLQIESLHSLQLSIIQAHTSTSPQIDNVTRRRREPEVMVNVETKNSFEYLDEDLESDNDDETNTSSTSAVPSQVRGRSCPELQNILIYEEMEGLRKN